MNKTHFSAPGNYRIEVQGQLRPGWDERFGALQVLAPSSAGDDTLTILQGRVSDQAELSGILNTLYELHLQLISVQYMNDASEPSP